MYRKAKQSCVLEYKLCQPGREYSYGKFRLPQTFANESHLSACDNLSVCQLSFSPTCLAACLALTSFSLIIKPLLHKTEFDLIRRYAGYKNFQYTCFYEWMLLGRVNKGLYDEKNSGHRPFNFSSRKFDGAGTRYTGASRPSQPRYRPEQRRPFTSQWVSCPSGCGTTSGCGQRRGWGRAPQHPSPPSGSRRQVTSITIKGILSADE